MAQSKSNNDYDNAVLAILTWESSSTDHHVTDAKIRRRLNAKKIGKYDQVRVDMLRRLKDEVRKEVGRAPKSKYFKSSGEFADMNDFDISQFTKDMSASFPKVPKQSVEEFIKYAIYLYYLR